MTKISRILQSVAEPVDAEDKWTTQVIDVIKDTCLSMSKHLDLVKTLGLSGSLLNSKSKRGGKSSVHNHKK